MDFMEEDHTALSQSIFFAICEINHILTSLRLDLLFV